MRDRLVDAVRAWIPIAIAVTAMAGLVYLAAQQSYRMSLNDPQLQMAQDAAAKLVDGAAPKSVASGKIDIAQSLGGWIMVFNDKGKHLAGAVSLEGTTPVPPSGVFDVAKAQGEDRVTWQPRGDVRQATIVEYWRGKAGSGYVVAGRNMREVEARIGQMGVQVAAIWALTLVATLVAAYVVGMAPRPKPVHPEEW